MPRRKQSQPNTGGQFESDNVYLVVNKAQVPSPDSSSNITSKNPVSERLLAYRAKIKKSYQVIADQITEAVGSEINGLTVRRAAKGAPLSELSILKIEEFLEKVGS